MKKGSPFIIFVSIAGILAVGALAACVWFWMQINSSALPAAITSQASFPVYYYQRELPAGLRLEQESVHYRNGVLFFTLKNGERSVSVSQQELPKDFSNTTVKGNEAVDGVDGSGTVSANGERTVGYYIPGDKKTFVIMNSTSVDSATMKDLVRFLRKQ